MRTEANDLGDGDLGIGFLRSYIRRGARAADLPDRPLFLWTRVRALLALANAYGKDDRRHDLAMSQAAQDAERLALHRDNAMAVQGRCFYYFVHGDDDKLLATVRQARQDHVGDTWVTQFEVSVLYARKELDEALRVLQSTKHAGDETIPLIERGIVLAAIPGREADAAKAMTDAISLCRDGSSLSYLPAYLRLLGPDYRAKIREIFAQIRESNGALTTPWRNPWYHDLLAFHVGVISDQELLKKASASRCKECEAHFYLGLGKLADGKRVEAKACFQHSVDAGVFYYGEYIWSRAFLARIDDPNWLPWIPMKKGTGRQ